MVHYLARQPDTDRTLRLRAILAVRLGSGIRSGDAASIRRSSVHATQSATGRYVVVFEYESKQSKAAGATHPWGYVDMVSDRTKSAQCLGQWLLDYVLRTKSNPEHDRLFTFENASHMPLSGARIGTLMNEVMRAVGIPDRFKPHSIRYAAVTKALLAGASLSDVMVRFAWATEQTVLRHYALPVATFNLADLAVTPVVNDAEVTEVI
jgi:site-specific recombinase XerD